MRTSQEWWDETKADPSKLEAWLVKQYRGEVTAASRIRLLVQRFKPCSKPATVLALIATQEEQHASWITELLQSRNIEVKAHEIAEAETRYWAETLIGIDSFETGTAVAAHAEKMRLERIRVIAEDTFAPFDIRHVFMKILIDELFHERAFRGFSTPEALAATAGNHELGMKALGLVA